MTEGERALVLAEMTRLGAFKAARRPLTNQQRACLAEWYTLRKLDAVKSKDKSSFNRYIKERFGRWNLADLSDTDTNKLYNMLEGWVRSVDPAAGVK